MSERTWFKHAEAAGFVFLEIPRGVKSTHVSGWTASGSKVTGKFAAADAALDWRGPGRCNLGVGSESGSRLRIVDADDDKARDVVTSILEAEGVTTLSLNTPRGHAWLFRLPDGADIPPLKEHEGAAYGIGKLGIRAAGQYQVAPGSVVEIGAYSQPDEAGKPSYKPPPDDSGGPWQYSIRDVAPVAVMPAKLVDALNAVRGDRGEPGKQAPPGGGARTGGHSRGARQALGCRTVEIGVAVLRDLVLKGSGRNDALYRVACSLIWHRALTRENHREVEAELIGVQRDLRAGESRDVTKEVPEQIDHAFRFIAEQGGSGASSDGDEPVPPPSDDVSGDLATWADWKDAAAKFSPSSPGALKREAPALLARIVRRFQGGDVGESRDTTATLDALQAAFGEGGDDAVKAVLEARGLLTPPRPPRAAVAVPDVEGDRPAPLLRLSDSTGAVLSLGTVGVLSGAGGMGKSALTASLALSLASRGDGDGGALVGGMFDAPIGGGPVLMATWEDAPAVTRWRIEAATKLLPGLDEAAVKRVFLMDMAGAPLYGPRAGEGEDGARPGLYNARPEPLPGWDDLWREVERIGARLVVIDPVLSAFVGNSNEAAPVREFLSALSVAATERDCAVLLVAHSTKAARNNRNQEPDPFDPGHVGGSAAWTDGVRSALILDWDDARGPRAIRLAVAKSNYGPARRLLPLVRVKVGAADAENHGATVAFRVEDGGAWMEHGAGDVDRSIKALVDGIKALRKAAPDADLSKLKQALGSPKGRNRRDTAGAVDDEEPI